MILIADSGSTKCDWAIIKSKDEIIEFNTMGFNPFFHNENLIVETLNKSTEIEKYKDQIDYVFYYGAGSATKELKLILQRALSNVFSSAKHIYSEHDLVAAALATYDGHPSISCILGTGSNSCYYDGDIVREEVPALGHILGDEGSGSYFGKKLITKYIYKQLPEDLNMKFQEKYTLDKATIFQNVYMRPHANVYLASFMKFLSDNKDNPFVTEIIADGFFEFASIHIKCFKKYKEVPVNFVGSVAYYFQEILQNVCKNLDIQVGVIVKRPIDGLVKYHLQNTFDKIHKK